MIGLVPSIGAHRALNEKKTHKSMFFEGKFNPLCIEKEEREGRFARGFESTCHPPSARAPTRAESNFADSMGGCLYKSSKLEYL